MTFSPIDYPYTLSTNTTQRLTKEQDETIPSILFIALASFSNVLSITIKKYTAHYMFFKNSIIKAHWILTEPITENAKEIKTSNPIFEQ